MNDENVVKIAEAETEELFEDPFPRFGPLYVLWGDWEFRDLEEILEGRDLEQIYNDEDED